MKDLEIFKAFAPKDNKELYTGTNTVIYTRVSSAGQEDNTSLGGQKKHCEMFAKKKGFTVVKYFGGTSESAKTDDRVEFNKMITYVKKTKSVRYILVYSYERFSRSGINGASIADELMKKYGIVTLAVSQELDPTTPSGSFQRNIYFLFSQFDNEIRKDKCVNGMVENLTNGYWTYKEPMGYTPLNRGEKAKNRKFEINQRGKLIQKVFRWKANDEIGNEEISRRLEKFGWKIKGKHLHSILRNPFYCGLITSKAIAGEVYQGHHPELVSKTLFLRANNVLDKNNTQPSFRNDIDVNLPLKRFMRCDDCNNPMTGYIMRKKNIYYYKCKTKGCCNNRNAGKLHNYFSSILEHLKIDTFDLPLFKAAITSYYETFFVDQIENQKLLKANLIDVQNKIDAMEERFAVGTISSDIFDKFYSKYKTEFTKINDEIKKFAFSSSNLEKCVDYLMEFCSNPLVWWEKVSFNQRVKLQTFLFPEGITYNRKKDLVRTPRINDFISPIPCVASDLNGSKKGKNVKFNIFPSKVGPPGLEPGTP